MTSTSFCLNVSSGNNLSSTRLQHNNLLENSTLAYCSKLFLLSAPFFVPTTPIVTNLQSRLSRSCKKTLSWSRGRDGLWSELWTDKLEKCYTLNFRLRHKKSTFSLRSPPEFSFEISGRTWCYSSKIDLFITITMGIRRRLRPVDWISFDHPTHVPLTSHSRSTHIPLTYPHVPPRSIFENRSLVDFQKRNGH